MRFPLAERPITPVRGDLPASVATNTGEVHGPTAIPYRSAFAAEGATPHHPGLYGRYLPIDLDDNNRASVEAWTARNPGREPQSLGWGVCRHGFGLQNFGDGRMSREVAEQRAIALNQGRPATDVPNV